jgi:hypothetical protein
MVSPITEDFVKTSVQGWLIAQGYSDVEARLGTRQGDDVSGKAPKSGRSIWVECKGATAATDQWDRAWRNQNLPVLLPTKRFSVCHAMATVFRVGLPQPGRSNR